MYGWDGIYDSPFDTPEERFWKGVRQNKSVSSDSHMNLPNRFEIKREEDQ